MMTHASDDSLMHGYWSLIDSTHFRVSNNDEPGMRSSARVNERIDSILIENRTIYKIAHGKKYLFGLIKWTDSLEVEYMRRCCPPEGKFKIDSFSSNYLRISRKIISRDEGYDPQNVYDAPYPRGEMIPSSTTVETNVVIFRRLTD